MYVCASAIVCVCVCARARARVRLAVCVCVRARVRLAVLCVCVCVCVRARARERVHIWVHPTLRFLPSRHLLVLLIPIGGSAVTLRSSALTSYLLGSSKIRP